MKIVITGSSGFIGSNVKNELVQKYGVVGIDNETAPTTDVKTDVSSIKIISSLERLAPEVIVHCAAQKDLVKCETNPKYFENNVVSTNYVCDYAKKHGSRVVLISSDVIFDGKKGGYLENARPNPINNYGLWKQVAETITLFSPNNCVLRTAMVFGNPPTLPDFYKRSLRNQSLFPQYVIERSKHGIKTRVANNVISNPTPVKLLCEIVKKAISVKASGIFHACSPFSMSRFEFARLICDVKGLDKRLIVPFVQNEGIRPLNISLDNSYTFKKLEIKYTKSQLENFIENIT